MLSRSKADLKSAESGKAKLAGELGKLRETAAAELSKAGENPWEEEDWQELSACETFEMLKLDLVPAQQARLAKLCMQELEIQLEENKSLLAKVFVEKEDLKNEKTKLEAKLSFINNSEDSKTKLSENNPSLRDKPKTTKSLVAPAKFTSKCQTKENEKEETKTVNGLKEKQNAQEKEKEDNETNQAKAVTESRMTRRRSTRSAATLATFMISDSLATVTEEGKRGPSTPQRCAEADKKVKVKVSESDSPPQAVRPGGSKLKEEREPLGCMTNSPAKQTKESLPPAR